MAKVGWSDVYRPLEEGGQGIRQLEPFNKALMSKHFWDILQCNSSSVWVTWIRQHYIGNCSIWTVGSGQKFWVWHDPWHPPGPLIHRFPRGPVTTGIPLDARLSDMIVDSTWSWPSITDIGHMEITDLLPPFATSDAIIWTSAGNGFSISNSYIAFHPPGLKVPWYGLLLGPFRIPRNCFILWLAILGRLSTMDRTWWAGPDSTCVLCSGRAIESHDHLFFQCEYSRACLRVLKAKVQFAIPLMEWERVIWASRRWRGRHPWTAASRALFASLVYHLWMERNRRRFGSESSIPEHTATLCLEQIRMTLLGAELRLNFYAIDQEATQARSAWADELNWHLDSLPAYSGDGYVGLPANPGIRARSPFPAVARRYWEVHVSGRKAARRITSSSVDNLVEYSTIPEAAIVENTVPPVISPYNLYRKRGSLPQGIRALIASKKRMNQKEQVHSSKMDHCSLPASTKELYVTLSIPPDYISSWKAEGYTHLHLGAVRLVLSYHGRKGLPVTAMIALPNTRFLEYEHAVIGTVLTTLNAGSIVVTFFLNFAVSLCDPHVASAFKVQVQITGANQVPASVMAPTPSVAIQASEP
ncbi:UNVERIFIED_CONTAM: polyprotein [Sesamum latifolium]|uniref:Polyprotein n=1 Tax=Sesamum latifolium TaxID=2727402 RepID=A0AAW2XQZ4_9LAMI